MRNVFVVLSCLSLACPVSAAGVERSLPAATIALHDGGKFGLRDVVGEKPVYLKFWASWCGTCREQMPHLERTFIEYGDDLTIVSVNIWVNESERAIDETIDEFGLSVPIAIDERGEFAQGFGIIGTPYHVLIDKEGDVVHTGSDADAALDRKIELLASERAADLAPVETDSTEDAAVPGIAPSDGLSVLFFVATWCDWYLEDSRPSMSAACVDAQRSMNQLYAAEPGLEIQGIATRLWTGEQELRDYVDKYDVRFPMTIDSSNDTFFAMNVKNVPTLIVFEDGREVARTSELRSLESVTEFVQSASR